MILKGAFGACLFLTFVTLSWAAPRGVGVGDAVAEPVQKGPASVRGSSRSHTFIWLGSGGK